MTEIPTTSQIPPGDIDPSFQHDPRINMPLAYGETAANVKLRFNLYKYAIDGQPEIHDRVIDSLGLKGHETVVDVGCSDGEILKRIRRDLNHKGDLIGVDIDEQLFDLTKIEMEAAGLPPIDFRTADSSETELESDSADVILIMFGIYHMLPEATLAEAMRVLKPGGKLVVTTSGLENKLKHRFLEALTADYLGIIRPPIFAAACDDKKLERLIGQQFGNVEHSISQQTFMQVPEQQSTEIMYSLGTMSHSTIDPKTPGGQPVEGHIWNHGLEIVAEPLIRAEMELKGYWEDTIDRHAVTAMKAA